MFGNLEQTFYNDRKSSQLQTPGKIQINSSIDHYFSLPQLVPPNLSFAPTTANLLPSNEMRSAFPASSAKSHLPTGNPHCYISPAPVRDNHSLSNEDGFSSLFSLEYSFPDYRSATSFEQLNSENFIDERQNVSSLQHQLYLKEAFEQVSPYSFQNYVQNNLSLHEQHQNLKRDPALSNTLNTKETNNSDFSRPSFIESTCLTPNWDLNNYLLSPFQAFGNIFRDSNCLEDSKNFFQQSKSNISSKANKVVTGKQFPEEKHFIPNLIPKNPGSNKTLENCNSRCISSNLLAEAPSSDVFKNEFVSQSGNLTSPYNDNKAKKEEVLKENLECNKVCNEKPKANECKDFLIDAIPNNEFCSTLPVNVLKTSLKPTTLKSSKTSDLSEFKTLEWRNSDCPVKENAKIQSTSPIPLSCQPILDFSSTETCRRDPLPVECDSTTESGLKATDLNDSDTDSLLPSSDKTSKDLQTRSGKTLESDENSAETLLTANRHTSASPPNKCRICKEFLLTERPELQQLTVPIDANYDVCNACNICFLQKSVLNTNSGDEKNPHRCTYCDRRFKKECYLVLHMKSHTTAKPFGCSECNKAFSHSAKLKMHSKVHSGDKPFACKECNRRFVQMSHLKMHSRVHFGAKSFKCSSCSKDFASKSRLSEHEKYHSPKLPFKCETCEKSFVKETYFESHLRIHCDAKPFECSTCKNRFAQKSVLRQHTRNCRFAIDSKISAALSSSED